MQRVKEINQITEDGLLLSDGTVVEFDDIQLPFGGSLVKARCGAGLARTTARKEPAISFAG